MQRRKFLIGAAGTAIGGSALVGSGAFTSVEANRDVVVDVADDNDAFLALNAEGGENTEYASYEDGIIAIDISGDGGRTGQNGDEGLNREATTTFLQLFEVENQGTETVGIRVQRADGWEDDFESAAWFVGDDHGANEDAGNTISDDEIQSYGWGDPEDDLRILAPGESVWVGAFFFNPDDFGSETYDFTIQAHNEDSAVANDL